MHKLQKKHLKEFREDRVSRGYVNVPHGGNDLAESECKDFHMPPLTPEDFQGWAGFPSTFATGEEDEGSEHSSAQ